MKFSNCWAGVCDAEGMVSRARWLPFFLANEISIRLKRSTQKNRWFDVKLEMHYRFGIIESEMMLQNRIQITKVGP